MYFILFYALLIICECVFTPQDNVSQFTISLLVLLPETKHDQAFKCHVINKYVSNGLSTYLLQSLKSASFLVCFIFFFALRFFCFQINYRRTFKLNRAQSAYCELIGPPSVHSQHLYLLLNLLLNHTLNLFHTSLVVVVQRITFRTVRTATT